MSCPDVVRVTVPSGPSVVRVVTPGPAGDEVELRVNATHIQWRYVGAPTWTNLIALVSLQGASGREVELRSTATHLQWRYVGEPAWVNLLELSTLGGGGVANVTAPITYDTGTKTVGISPATTSAAGSMSAADKTKLDGVAAGATANATDAQLRDRSTHTGTQSAGTITGLASVATSGAYSDLSGKPSLGGAAALNIGQTAGTVAAGDDSRFAELKARLDAFRDAATFYVSKGGSNTNNGTSPGEPLLTIGAAVTAANAYVTANPGAKAKILVGPGEFTEASLPFRLKPNILAQGALQRGTTIKPASGQEMNGFWALDSGCMVADFTHSGHQATGTSSTDSTVGTRAWAVRLNEAANSGAGVFLTASPYVKDCASITAEDDAGLAGSTSTGDTGGGVLVDGAACRSDSPIRSLIVYGFTQQNLGGPGAVIRNDGYAELVSFFGLFGTWHVQCETGGQATLSGGGASEFGIYGLVADGYSPTALFTGSLRAAASAGALTVDVVSLTANRLGSSSRPAAGQILLIGGNPYVIQSSTPIDASGTVVTDTAPTRAGYRVTFFNPSGSGLVANVSQGATADFRQRSQISAGCHSANYVGAGTNYSALPWNGGVPIRGNEAVERNLGRVFGLIVNDVGDVKVAGGAFAVDGTTGAVTISTSQFNLSGLNAVGPFSRNGGASTVGVQLQEVSNNTSLLASTGVSAADTAPTQFAVRSYSDNRFLAGLSATAGQPISVSDTSTQDGSGYWTRSRNIELSLNAPNGLARLDGSGLIPSSLLPTTDAMGEGSSNLFFTTQRARSSISVSGSLGYNPTTGVISYTAPTLASVATSGLYQDLLNPPTLGTAASKSVPATGDASSTQVVLGSDSRLTDAREWSALTIPQHLAEGGTDTNRAAWTVQRVWQAIAAWWGASSAKTKLDGIASGATANQTDAYLLSRANHTGTQAASTISDLATVATSGSASDLTSGTMAAERLPSTGVRFDQLGIGTAAVSGWDLVIADSLAQRRLTVTASSGTYTLDVQAGNEFATSAAINGATTINLSNLANIPSGYLWRGVLCFVYTSGTISWFTGNSGYTVKWDGGTAMTPTASDTEKVVIEVVGGGNTIEIAPLKGRA